MVIKRKVIVNADDLGLTRSVSEGIFKCIDLGSVGDASLMANGTAFDYAVTNLRDRKISSIGVHLCVLDGEEPISKSGTINILLDTGKFPISAKPYHLFIKSIFHPFKVKRALEVEFSAQIEKILNSGFVISHADSHQHVHIFPVISGVVLSCCRKYNIPYVRIPISELRTLVGFTMNLLGHLFSINARLVGIKPIPAVGYDLTGKEPETSILKNLKTIERRSDGITELIVHPGYADSVTKKRYSHWRCTDWEFELEALNRQISGSNIEGKFILTNYASLEKNQEMKCPFCGSVDHEIPFTLRSNRVAKCKKCDVLYNIDFLKSQSSEEIFSEEYYKKVQSAGFSHIWDQEKKDPSAPLYEMGLNEIEKIKSIKYGSRILDVGCAFGAFLKVAKKRGLEAYGVELSPYSSKVARENFGLNVFTGNLLDSSFQNSFFDVITFWDVIEHTTNPAAQLLKAAELLKPGGALLLTTDNYDSLISSIGEILYKSTGGSFTYPMDRFYIPHNSCYLVRNVLYKLLNKMNFKIVYDCGIDHPIDRINLSGAEKLILNTLYSAGKIMGKESQFILIATKNK
jgi:predicted glycoside hydrolase/deacetylase ChbG (UPF0249 family)/2-polyprenyl-3-methyl-5-hydroxy-6-metoxy-1,4-benzoquinol methylase